MNQDFHGPQHIGMAIAQTDLGRVTRLAGDLQEARRILETCCTVKKGCCVAPFGVLIRMPKINTPGWCYTAPWVLHYTRGATQHHTGVMLNHLACHNNIP